MGSFSETYDDPKLAEWGLRTVTQASQCREVSIATLQAGTTPVAATRKLKQRRRRRQRERQKKAIGLDWQNNNNLHVRHALLYIFLPSPHDYDAKMPNPISRFVENVNTTTFFLLSCTSIQSFRNFNFRRDCEHLMN